MGFLQGQEGLCVETLPSAGKAIALHPPAILLGTHSMDFALPCNTFELVRKCNINERECKSLVRGQTQNS